MPTSDPLRKQKFANSFPNLASGMAYLLQGGTAADECGDAQMENGVQLPGMGQHNPHPTLRSISASVSEGSRPRLCCVAG